jgi:predicted TIM-barrel fold metal-dependent hydrolase
VPDLSRRPVPPGAVDAHHHLWVRSRFPQPWIDPATMGAIEADFEPADLEPVARAAGVVATVVVQSVGSVAETAHLLAVAAGSALVRAVVGWVDLTATDVAAQLRRLRDGTGGDRLVGIRHLVQSEDDPGYLDRADVRRGVAAVGDAGLVYDLLVRDHQLPAATRLVRDLPGTAFVLDHLGKPDLAGGRLTEWRRDLSDLAALPNVTAKVSGLVTEADWARWTPDDLRPAVDHALAVFGADRLMFGSDWPVVRLAASYDRWVEAADGLTGTLDARERASFWSGTARAVYGLDRLAGAGWDDRPTTTAQEVRR